MQQADSHLLGFVRRRSMKLTSYPLIQTSGSMFSFEFCLVCILAVYSCHVWSEVSSQLGCMGSEIACEWLRKIQTLDKAMTKEMLFLEKISCRRKNCKYLWHCKKHINNDKGDVIYSRFLEFSSGNFGRNFIINKKEIYNLYIKNLIKK